MPLVTDLEGQRSCVTVRKRDASSLPVPTSVYLSRMLDRAQAARVPVGWLMDELGERSFGLTLLVMAVIALLPGASAIVGLLIAWPAIQLMLGHEAAALPRAMARREVAVARLERVIAAIIPRLAWVERLIRPRCTSRVRDRAPARRRGDAAGWPDVGLAGSLDAGLAGDGHRAG